MTDFLSSRNANSHRQMTMSRTINRVQRRSTGRSSAAPPCLGSSQYRQRVLSSSGVFVTASRDLESEVSKNFRSVFGICINPATSER